MEEKIVFPVGDETAQELKDKALNDNDVSEVSGGWYPKYGEWMCCGRLWRKEEYCSVCGKRYW